MTTESEQARRRRVTHRRIRVLLAQRRILSPDPDRGHDPPDEPAADRTSAQPAPEH